MKFVKVLALLLLLYSLSSAQSQQIPEPLKEVGINERIGATLPMQAVFTNHQGTTAPLDSFIQPDIPTIVSLVYFNCPMLCNLVLSGFTAGLRELKMEPNKQYQLITISIDTTDTPDSAFGYREKYLSLLGEEKAAQASKGWHFLTGSRQAIDAVSDSIGFSYTYNPETKQYAHAAGVFIFTPENSLSRVLYGIDFKPFDLRLSLTEAKNNKSHSTLDKLLLFCYRYDPDERSYALHARQVMSAGGGVTVGVIGLLGFILFRNEKKRKSKSDN